jgi:hypothetical protein
MRPTYLFFLGVGASFALYLVCFVTLFRRREIDAENFWDVTILTSLGTFLLGSLPVFGGMAIIAGFVQRQASRKAETKCLFLCLLICSMLTCIGVVLASGVYFEPTDSSRLRFFLFLETSLVCAILCCLIILSLLLRVITGFKVGNFAPNDFVAHEDNGR